MKWCTFEGNGVLGKWKGFWEFSQNPFWLIISSKLFQVAKNIGLCYIKIRNRGMVKQMGADETKDNI